MTIALNVAITDVFKVFAGRLRPNFLARCNPSADGDCINIGSKVRDARLSFPSGHSSLSFACMFYLSCYIAGKLRLFRYDGGAIWKAIACVIPLIMAGFIAVSRTLDYHHDYSDILGGTIIGSFIGVMCYMTQYYSLFSKYA
jgi:membrane-associated phospholipid phosphatase